PIVDQLSLPAITASIFETVTSLGGCRDCIFFFSSRRRHTRSKRDWSSTCALPIFALHRTSSTACRCRATASPRSSPNACADGERGAPLADPVVSAILGAVNTTWIIVAVAVVLLLAVIALVAGPQLRKKRQISL